MAVGTSIASTTAVLVLSPFLLLTALFLLPIAVLTTVLAASTLSLRAFLIYMELFVALVRNQLSRSLPAPSPYPLAPGTTTTAGTTTTTTSANASSNTLPRTRSMSSSSGGSRTPKFEPGAVPPTPLTRDFEGVGGWRLLPAGEEGEDESEGQWLTMNSRLELPAASSLAPEQRTAGEQRSHNPKHHHRHSTTSSLLQPGQRRPVFGSRPSSMVLSGTVSPVGAAGLEGAARVKSMVQLGEVEKEDRLRERRRIERRKSSSSSNSSAKTLVLSGKG